MGGREGERERERGREGEGGYDFTSMLLQFTPFSEKSLVICCLSPEAYQAHPQTGEQELSTHLLAVDIVKKFHKSTAILSIQSNSREITFTKFDNNINYTCMNFC